MHKPELTTDDGPYCAECGERWPCKHAEVVTQNFRGDRKGVAPDQDKENR